MHFGLDSCKVEHRADGKLVPTKGLCVPWLHDATIHVQKNWIGHACFRVHMVKVHALGLVHAHSAV